MTSAKMPPAMMSMESSDDKKIYAPDLMAWAAASTLLAEITPDRVTISQLIFFVHAGLADMRGHPLTFTEIKDRVGPAINRTLHATYRILLDGNPRADRPSSIKRRLNWLYREENPSDNREKLLRLTPQGWEILQKMQSKMQDAKKEFMNDPFF